MLSEKKLESIIFNAIESDKKALADRGFPMPDSPQFYRQVKLGDYGIVDILALGRDSKTDRLDVYVYELKRDVVGATNLPQLTDYMGGVKEWLQHEGYQEDDYAIIGILMAPKVNFSLSYFLGKNVLFFEVEYDPFTGIAFSLERYSGYSNCECKDIKVQIPPKSLEFKAD